MNNNTFNRVQDMVHPVRCTAYSGVGCCDYSGNRLYCIHTAGAEGCPRLGEHWASYVPADECPEYVVPGRCRDCPECGACRKQDQATRPTWDEELASDMRREDEDG